MKTIFAVDDNRINLLITEEVLSDRYEVITMLSAAVMFELLEEITPDLILLDIMMPEVDGFAALKRLKEDKRYEDIPVIFLTGKKDNDAEVLAFEMGITDFISKPFSAPILLNRVKMVLHMEDIISERLKKLQNAQNDDRTGEPL
ncbi:MAG: response regulator [Defluviitaleaceae bacterium]|nr:response regulator [Defluviitaleaceae bacterium]